MVAHKIFCLFQIVLAPACHFGHSLFSRYSGSVSFLKQSFILILQSCDYLVEFLGLFTVFCKFEFHVFELSDISQSIVVFSVVLFPPDFDFVVSLLDDSFKSGDFPPADFQFLLVPDGFHEFGVKGFFIEPKTGFVGPFEFILESFYLVLQHFVLFFEFLLTEVLSVVLSLQFLDGFPESEYFLFLFGDGFEVIRTSNEYLIGVIDDLAQFNVLRFQLLDLEILFVELVAEIVLDSGGPCLAAPLRTRSHFPHRVDFMFELCNSLLVGACFISQSILQLADFDSVMLQFVVSVFVFELIVLIELHPVLRHFAIYSITNSIHTLIENARNLLPTVPGHLSKSQDQNAKALPTQKGNYATHNYPRPTRPCTRSFALGIQGSKEQFEQQEAQQQRGGGLVFPKRAIIGGWGAGPPGQQEQKIAGIVGQFKEKARKIVKKQQLWQFAQQIRELHCQV